jgi:hypothetical protein
MYFLQFGTVYAADAIHYLPHLMIETLPQEFPLLGVKFEIIIV